MYISIICWSDDRMVKKLCTDADDSVLFKYSYISSISDVEHNL